MCKRDFFLNEFRPSTGCQEVECVEVKMGKDDVQIRNTTAKNTITTFNRREWETFVKGVKSGEFDF